MQETLCIWVEGSNLRKKMKWVSLILFTFLLIGTKTGSSQMDAQTLIRFLNVSKTLIQDAEIKFLWYVKTPTPPADVGADLQALIEHRKQEYRDAPQKTSNPDALRKDILENIDLHKTYGNFQYSEEFFLFKEVNLIFQLRPDATEQKPLFGYRMAMISRFDNFSTVDFKRYYDCGRQEMFAVNTQKGLSGHLPNQFANDNRMGDVKEHSVEDDVWMVSYPFWVPPAFIDQAHAQIKYSDTDRGDVYIITHFPLEKVMAKVYVRNTDIPESFREEYYYKSESPNANKDGYWLRSVKEYSNFVHLKTIGIAYPKIAIEKEYRADGFLRYIEIITIIDMAFNQGLPANFFDWNIREYLIDTKASEIQ